MTSTILLNIMINIDIYWNYVDFQVPAWTARQLSNKASISLQALSISLEVRLSVSEVAQRTSEPWRWVMHSPYGSHLSTGFRVFLQTDGPGLMCRTEFCKRNLRWPGVARDFCRCQGTSTHTTQYTYRFVIPPKISACRNWGITLAFLVFLQLPIILIIGNIVQL